MSAPPNNNQRFFVTIPRGVRPGQRFALILNGQQMVVRCPEGNKPGDRLIVTSPRTQEQQYMVTVPPNVKAGDQFCVKIKNKELMVTCPRGVKPGQKVTIKYPQSEQSQAPVPNNQLFEVEIPDGVRPGSSFTINADGQQVILTCPPNARCGQRITFQIPAQLSQEQLQAIRVSYNEEGWMRCLGIDLKFHWIYNKSNTTSEENTHKTPYDMDVHAFVRELLPPSSQVKPRASQLAKHNIRYIDATQYAIETSVKGTRISYQDLNSVAQKSFQERVEWLKTQFLVLRTPWEEGFIKIKVRRHNLLRDTMDAIQSIEVADMRKMFRFEFIGEPALDAGGVTREFYTCISEQLFNPYCGLFLYSAVNPMSMQINPNSGIANEEHLRYFHTA
eukprot:gene29309-38383_t